MSNETYLGDGLYARFDGFAWWLRAPRDGGDHLVCLEPDVLSTFLDLVQKEKPDVERRDGAPRT